MPYSAAISQSNPTAFVFLLDQSDSMRQAFGAQPEKSKADGVADALNRLLQNLVLKCAKADGVRDYFHIGMVSYGGPVESAFRGPLAGGTLVPVGRIANNPLRVEVRTRKVSDGAGGVTDQQLKFPVWFESRPGGRTPMCGALRLARDYLREFLRTYPGCYPPIVVNITDGQPTDGEPDEPATEIRALASKDGNVLLFNAHVSDKPDRPIEYPTDESRLPDKYARKLFQMSSPLPPRLAQVAKDQGFPVGPLSRGFVFNADLVAVVRFLDIGTKVSQGGK
ncbi:MAG TPA: hypothetical protein VFW33_15825 [Gemmataceae bacterium]|nr:hypothetical protein [Gemmataceae bacterium]